MTTFKKFSIALLSCATLLAFPQAANASLIALYKYDNATNLGLDSSGNGNNLISLNTTPVSVAGVYGGGIDFNGRNALATASGTLNGVPTGNSSYTISSWINPTTAGGNNAGGIVGWGAYGSNNQTNALRMNGNNQLHNYWRANDLSSNVVGDLTVGSGSARWHFVAATYNAGTGVNAIYIDGNLVGSRVAYGLNAQGTNFAVGRTVGDEFFFGQMDNKAIFNEALTLAQLNTIATNNFAQFGVANVPEPGSMLLLSIGALAVFGASRRKKSA